MKHLLQDPVSLLVDTEDTDSEGGKPEDDYDMSKTEDGSFKRVGMAKSAISVVKECFNYNHDQSYNH